MNSKNKNKKNIKSQSAQARVGWGLPLFLITLTAICVGGLVYMFTPKNELVPYNPSFGKQEANKPENQPEPQSSEPKKIPVQVEDLPFVDEPQVVKTATPEPSAMMTLSPEAMQHISKGMELTEKGKYNHAELEFQKASEISPDSPEVFAIWGAALRMQGKYKGANRRFQKAHDLAPKDEEILFNWALVKMEERKSEEAIDLFDKTLEIDPQHYMAYNYKGKALGQKKRYTEETQMYKKALGIKPDFAEGHFNLAIVLSIRNMVQEAVPHFERAIELDPQFDKPFVKQMLAAMGRYQPPAKKSDDKKKQGEQEKTAKVKKNGETGKDTKADAKVEEKKAEGSGHQMEGSGSKSDQPHATIKGTILVNDKPIGSHGVVVLETKNKLKVPKQTTNKLVIKQKALNFSPMHSVVPVNSEVMFINEDNEVHNIYSKSQKNQFNLGAMAAGGQKSIKLSQPGPVILRCNLHRYMIGTIFVVPNGYYAETDSTGNFKLDEVVNQEYIMQVWHPRLYPEEVAANLKSVKVEGIDQTFDLNIKSASAETEIHDLVDETDYKAVADSIEKEVFEAISDWDAGKKYRSRTRMLKAITKHYDGEGLKQAIAKSFSEKRSANLEKKLDIIRKKISGIKVDDTPVSKEALESEAKFTMSQIRNTIQELEHRLKPDKEAMNAQEEEKKTE